jgi:Uma2 family endonuclease
MWLKKRPEFVSEILSPSTRQKDLVAKRELYASEGVPFYLILDPEDNSALLLELGEDAAYREIAPESSFELHPGCQIQLSIGPLFA